jgi:eukaryotic-like serine/threonine-protein kinase
MKRDEYTRMEEAFHRARALTSPGERSAFLQALASESKEFARQVARLLDASGDADAYFADLAARSGIPYPSADLHSLPPGRRDFGPYRLLELLGHGGMGTVYRARRADAAFEKEVAIKLLPPGLGTPTLRARFQTERQILARLEHPGISRLLDGGVSEEGTPFLVMEYVEGKPIDIHCRESRLDLDTRLALFLEVCETVEFAHRNLVVHRDLKPSNILVDGEGRARLLDFGIAKVLGSDLGDMVDPDLTRLGGRFLTPSFGSPEQLQGEPVTTGTDVYALGLLLYLLLTDERAYDLSGLTPAEQEEVVCRIDPPPPSRTAAERGHPPWAKRLEGDLDAIVLTALAKEPARRYSQVRELAEDLRRFQSGHPVRARPQTAAYRASRFLRRNRTWAGAATIISLLLVALTGLAVHSARTASAQAELLALERDRAQLEAQKAEQVMDFLVNAFEQANPAGGQGVEVTALEILESGAEQAIRDLSHQPELQAEILAALADIHRRMGVRSQARPLAEQALAILEAQPGAAEADLFDLRLLVARVTDGNLAISRFREILPLAETRFAGDDHTLGTVLASFATSLFWNRDPSEDEEKAETFERAIELLRRAGPGEESELALARTLLTSAYGAGNPLPHDEAVARGEEALAIRRRVLGEGHGLVATTLSDLALFREQVDPLAADTLMRQAVDIHRQWAGESHTTTITLINNLAGIKRDRGDLESAEPLYREALRLRRQYQPEERVPQAYSEYGLGVVLLGLGRPAEAVPLLEAVAATFSESDLRGRAARERLAEAKALLSPGG